MDHCACRIERLDHGIGRQLFKFLTGTKKDLKFHFLKYRDNNTTYPAGLEGHLASHISRAWEVSWFWFWFFQTGFLRVVLAVLEFTFVDHAGLELRDLPSSSWE